MFKREKSIEILQHRGVQCAHGKVAVQGIGMSVYSFFVDGLLIDTGSYSLSQEFQSFFNDIRIEQLALTHCHEDHAGNAAWIQRHKNVPIYIHRDSVNLCAEDGDYPLYRQALWGNDQRLLPNHLVIRYKRIQPYGMSLKHLDILRSSFFL